jgi:hypothetical protein
MDRTLKYYLAGPMSGYPQHNLPLFEEVVERLRSWGLDVTSPTELDGNDVAEFREVCMADTDGSVTNIGGGDVVCGVTWGDLLARDIKLLADTLGGIILLPHWENSKGARLEAFVALNCEYPAYYYIDGVCVEATYEDIMEKINDSIIR